MMEKPTEAALAAFDDVFPAEEEAAVRKKMFGMPAGFVHGNMFLGVFGNGVVFRLPPARQVELGERHDTLDAFAPGGRRWKDYVRADASTDDALLRDWAREALAHTATLPPKAKKK